VEGVLAVVTIIVGFVGFLAFADFVRVHSMTYRLDETGLTFVGVLWRPKPIPYWQIESVRVLSWLDYFLLDRDVSWFNTRMYTTRNLTRKFVAVWHRDGRVFILTPDDREAFVGTLNQRIAGTAPPKLADRSSSSAPSLSDDVSFHKVPR